MRTLLYRTGLLVCVLSLNTIAFAQTIKGKVFDAETQEPLPGASVSVPNSTVGTNTNENGSFVLNADVKKIQISFVGYDRQEIEVTPNTELKIALKPNVGNLQTVVVTASREAQLRTEAPVAISRLSPMLINETKPTLLTEVINKVPGVVMVNLNNEQHAMAIRQPLSYNSYFLYLEDGIPVRPMGVFNHNALIEMNVFAVNSVEVVKGPASSLYGPEAIGGAINFITVKPTAVPTARVGIQADNFGYQRLQFGGGAYVTKKLGVSVAGFVAKQRNGWQTYSDYDKFSINARVDYQLTDRTKIIGSVTQNTYNSDMSGSVDSAAFYSRRYVSFTDFAYRDVQSTRARVSVEHQWNAANQTVLHAFYRKNAIGQFPSYAIRRINNDATRANAEINESSFHSEGLIVQHTARFNFLNSKLISGLSFDHSPNAYWAYYVGLNRNTDNGFFSIRQERPDSLLVNYQANLLNSAAYAQYEFSANDKLRFVLGGRYDRMDFGYDDYLKNTSGNKSFVQLTPRLGATYDFGNGKGWYANYSRGFSPPSVNSIFRDPNGQNLQPAQFDNYETGGWASFWNNKVFADVALYQMNGRNEIVRFLLPDNTSENRSAGRTLHRGIEYSLTYKPTDEWFFRFGGTNAVHRFADYNAVIQVGRNPNGQPINENQNYDGKDMQGAPGWIANTELTYKPRFLKGFRISAEWQRISSYYQDNANLYRYEDRTLLGLRGVSVLNLRAGYTWKGIEVFANLMNATNELYANNVSRANFGTNYSAAAPRMLTWGVQYNFTGK